MKFRLTATAIREYNVNPKDYGDCTVEEMLAIDRAIVEDDLDLMLDHLNTKWDLKIEEVNWTTT